jgi:hypothetical protein
VEWCFECNATFVWPQANKVKVIIFGASSAKICIYMYLYEFGSGIVVNDNVHRRRYRWVRNGMLMLESLAHSEVFIR